MPTNIVINKEFQGLIPSMAADEFNQLEENILSDGKCLDPLIVWNGVIVDGHNRWMIIQKHPGIAYRVEEMQFDDVEDVKIWITLHQLGKRNLSAYDRAGLVEIARPMIAARNKEKQKGGQGGVLLVQNSAQAKSKTREELAAMAGMSHDTLDRANFIKKHGTEEQIARARQGGKGNSLNSVYLEIKKDRLVKEGVESIKCKACGVEKSVDDFEPGRTSCRACRNKQKFSASIPNSEPEPIPEAETAAPVKPEQLSRRDIMKSIKEAEERMRSTENKQLTSDTHAAYVADCIADFTETIAGALGKKYPPLTQAALENKEKITAAIHQMEHAVKSLKNTIGAI